MSPTRAASPRRDARERTGRRRLQAVQPQRRLPGVPFVMLTVALVIVGVLGIVVLSVTVDSASFAVSRLQQLDSHEQATYSLLRDQVDQLAAPSRIASQALADGLTPAADVRVIRWPVPKAPPGAATSPAAPGGFFRRSLAPPVGRSAG